MATSFSIVVSFGKSSGCVSKIALTHTAGSRVVLTTLGRVLKDGTISTRNQDWKKMSEINGSKAIGRSCLPTSVCAAPMKDNS